MTNTQQPEQQSKEADTACGVSVSWWDGEYEGTCELPDGHQGPHYDGLSCFDNEGEEVELKHSPIPSLVLTLRYQRDNKGLYENYQVLDGQNRIVTFTPEPGVRVMLEIKS